MAENAAEKERRRVEGAGERVLLAALEMDSHRIAPALVEAGIVKATPRPRDTPDPRAKAQDRAEKEALKLLDVREGGGVMVYVVIGQAKAEDADGAVEGVLGENAEGLFRAVPAPNWRTGGVNREPETRIVSKPLD
jgi:hypothetical protein